MLDPDYAIAVVGMAARVPGARDIDEFWLNLVRGDEATRFLTEAELAANGVPASALADPAYVRAVCAADDIAEFDATLFRMSPHEADLTDPQIRMFLEVAHSALEDAGYDPARLDERVGVFASGGSSGYLEQHLRPSTDLMAHAESTITSLNRVDYLATTTSYKLNLRGPSITVQTACSSSLVALHLAARSLQVGECDIAVVGGADVHLPLGHGYRWQPGSVLSRDGHVRPFDKGASGTLFGSGAAAVVLRRLGQAQACADRIRAVVRGSAVNNDGSDKVSFGAPSISGQTCVIVEAMQLADVRPQDISYVEAHATGTVMGDPIEIAALADAYRRLCDQPLVPGSCAIGSVKGNIGHLGSVAGIIGFIKTALALEREQLPASINCTEPNPNLELDKTPFVVNTQLRSWAHRPGVPRRAGLSSLGIGGSNVHVVIEEAPHPVLSARADQPRLLVWSGLTPQACQQAQERLLQFVARHPDTALADAAATLQYGRAHHRHRAAAVCLSTRDAIDALACDASRAVRGDPALAAPRAQALMFPGQGAQTVTMAAGLYAMVPGFAAAFDQCLELFDAAGIDLRPSWRGAPGAPPISDNLVIQPLLFSVEYAIASMYIGAGVTCAAVLGHSVGELAAATVAGIWRLDDAVAIVSARTRATEAAPPGAMLAVAAVEQAVSDVLSDAVRLAAVNGDRQIVLSGPVAEIAAARAALSQRGIAAREMSASRAFHHPMLAGAADAVADALARTRLARPSIPLYSAASGRLLTDEQATDPSFWAAQITRPVRFAAAANAMLDSQNLVVIEAGPGQTLTALLKRHPAIRSGRSAVVSTLPARATPAADQETMLTAVARLWTDGHDVSWADLGLPAPAMRVALPHYPYQRQRHWVEPGSVTAQAEPATAADAAPAHSTAGQEPPRSQRRVSAFAEIVWCHAPTPEPRAPRREGTALVLLPDDSPAELTILRALHLSGMRTIRVRPGSGYASGEEFTARPGVREDLDRILTELDKRRTQVDALVHATAAQDWEPWHIERTELALQASFFNLLNLVQGGLRATADHQLPELLVLTTECVNVSGSERLQPVKSVLPGAVRSLAKEIPWLACRVVDFAANTTAEDLSDEVCHTSSGEILVALRGGRRWVPRETSLDVTPGTATAIRPDGVYVITGGLGGLGLSLARALAGTGLCPKIALLGRRVPAGQPDESDLWSQGVQASIASLRALGAQIQVISCDVADRRQLRRALDVTSAVFGQVNGVFHFAGVAGDGMLARRGREAAQDVLRPKVQGTVTLAEVLAGRPEPDFVLLASSRAATDGLIGSADYAAGNAVLDAMAARTGALPGRVISVGFPSWREVGMAARTVPVKSTAVQAEPTASTRADETVWDCLMSAESHWALDEHRLAGTPVLPGTAIIDLIIRASETGCPAEAGKGALEVTDLAFTRPLVVAEPRDVRIAFTATGPGRLTVMSRRQGGDEDWVTHATGRAERVARQPRTVDAAALRDSMPERPLPDMASTGRTFVLGPRWHAVVGVHGAGTERVLDLELPEAFHLDLAEHPLHPALLDCATGAVRDEDEPPHLPFIYRKIAVFGRLPAKVTVHVRRKRTAAGVLSGDVDVLDAQGRQIVAVEGFTMRQVDGAVVAQQVVAPARLSASAESLSAVQPCAARTDAARPKLADTDAGIPPEVGCQLIFSLLSARTPEHVLVRPFSAGRPVPLDAEPRVVTSTAGPRSVAAPPAPIPATVAGPAGLQTAARVNDEPATVSSQLRTLWIQSLGIEDIGQDDDFFDLGGNSLSAVELMSRIRDDFGVELNIGLLFDAPTLRELTGVIEQEVT